MSLAGASRSVEEYDPLEPIEKLYQTIKANENDIIWQTDSELVIEEKFKFKEMLQKFDKLDFMHMAAEEENRSEEQYSSMAKVTSTNSITVITYLGTYLIRY